MKPKFFREPDTTLQALPAVMNRLENWLSERRWSLEWSRKEDDHVDFTLRKIVVNSSRRPQSQVFGILHEIGHILLSETHDYTLRFSSSDGYKRRKEKKRESLKVRVEVMGEEWEAWNMGEQFARKIGLNIDYNALRATRNRDLKSYAAWLLEEV
jgi:hypothetical protein